MLIHEYQKILLDKETSSTHTVQTRSRTKHFEPNCIKRRKKFWFFLTSTFLVIVFNFEESCAYLQDRSAIGKEVFWTWVCQNKTCVRHHTTEGYQMQSHITCTMFCGHPQLWPQPTGPYSLSDTIVPVMAEKFSVHVIHSPSTKVTNLIRYTFDLFKNSLRLIETNELKSKFRDAIPYKVFVYFTINKDPDPRLRLNTDESYELNIKPRHDKKVLLAHIKGDSFCGVRHGLETLLQLIWPDPYKSSLVSFDEAIIQDAPKFKYRGIMLDTARNFFPVRDIIRMLDGMAANKLNTFHWHATDSQSFPLVLTTAPHLSQQGAYRRDAVYTREDITAIVKHALMRGIRVVIEIDAPAHVGSAFVAGPLGQMAVCVEDEPWHKYCGEPPCGQLNPNNENVYKLLEELYAEILELTGVTDVFHLGGDEVNENCWRKFYDKWKPKALWHKFLKRAQEALARANGGRTPEMTTIWSSSLTDVHSLTKLDKKAFSVQLWDPMFAEDQSPVLDAGFRSIISHVNPWYFDCGKGSWLDSSDGHCTPYPQWQEVYAHRPWSSVHGRRWRVEGGEACLWSEQLGPEGLDTRLWPRGIALAERLWTDPDDDLNPDTTIRLDTQRARLLMRDIRVDPIWPRWCTQNPLMCLDSDQ